VVDADGEVGVDVRGGVVGAGVHPGGTFVRPAKQVRGSVRGVTVVVGGAVVAAGGGGGATGAAGGGAGVGVGRAVRAGARVACGSSCASVSGAGSSAGCADGSCGASASVGRFARLGALACDPSPRRDAAHADVAQTTAIATTAKPAHVATITAELRFLAGRGGGEETARITDVGMSSGRTIEVCSASTLM
jgi:hypothetical protein